MAIVSLDRREKLLLALAFVVALAVKLTTVLLYAPAVLGDNHAFIKAADEILAGTRWLHDAGLAEVIAPPTLWRPIGYSLVIAGIKLVFGTAWPYALCTIQAGLSLGAGLLLARLCLVAGMGMVIAVAVFLLYQGSVPLSTDVLVMEDALTGALGTTALYAILRPVAGGRRPALGAFLTAGLLAGLSFLIRDVYHFVMPVLGVVAAALLVRRASWHFALAAGAALVVPVFLIATALQLWNEHRTGHPVTTTAGQTAYIYGVLRAAEFDPAVIGGPSRVEAVLRETNVTFDYVDTGRASQVLFAREGMNAIAQFEAARTLFWGTLWRHPSAYLKASLKRLRFVQQASLFASPLTRLDDLHWWAGGATEAGYRTGWRADALRFAMSRSFSDLTLPVFVHLGVRKACQFLGIGLFVLFLVGTPLLWLTLRREIDGPADAAILAWAAYGLWVCMYLPVSFEVRYLSPVIGPALFATALVVVNGRRLATAVREAFSPGNAAARP